MRQFAIAFGLSVLLAGCQSPHVTESINHRIASDDAGGQLEFWHALPGAAVVSNDDALHAVLIYLDGRDPIQTYAHRLVELKERGLLPGSFNEPADVAVTRGTLATVLVRMLEVDGGLMMRVLGGGPRYATREMQYLNLYPLSSPQQTFSGAQIVEVFSKVEDYQRRHPGLESPHPPVAAQPRSIPSYDIKRLALAKLVAALTASPTFFAQAPPEAPEAQPVAAQPHPNALTVQVTAVQGLVQVRTAEDAPWQPATVGQQLPVGAEFRTGPRSVVRFKVGPTQTVTLDRLGTVKVLDALKRDDAVVTDVGMKYGRTTLQVQAAGIEHQSQIRSPGATLAVRGSIGLVEDIGSTLRAVGLEGDVAWSRGMGRFITLPPDSEQQGNDTATGETRLAEGAYNPAPFGTTGVEQTLLSQYTSGTFLNEQIGADTFAQQDGMDDHGGEPSPTLIIGDLFVNVGFRSLENLQEMTAADIDLRLLTPDGAMITATLADPLGLLVHSGDAVSANTSSFVDEAIFSESNEVLSGSYSATLTNNGPADAGFSFQTFFNESLISSGEGGNLGSGQSVIYNFQINSEGGSGDHFYPPPAN